MTSVLGDPHAALSLEPAQRRSTRYGWARVALGVLCGVLAGALIPMAMRAGLQLHFPDESPRDTWTMFWWKEHWALRALASSAASLGAGFIAGLVARRRGRLSGGLAGTPTALIWATLAYFWWFKQSGLAELDPLLIDASIGNKLVAALLALSTIPVAVYGGALGEPVGAEYGRHFDSRRFALLGVKWFHFLWLPLFIHVLIMNVAHIGIYGLMWAKLAWQSTWDGGFVQAVPVIFTAAVYGTFWIIFTGCARAYRVLAGLDSVPGVGQRFLIVLGNGPGKFLLGVACQVVVYLLHAGLTALLE